MAILVRLAAFQDNRYHESREVDAADIGLNTEHDPMRIEGKVKLDITAIKTLDGDVLVKIPIKCKTVQSCVSCLDDVARELNEELTMLYSPEHKREEAPEPTNEVESPDIAYFNGDAIDLEEEVAGFILQATPEYPRCRPDCKGLDPVTGLNLNHTSPAEVKARREELDNGAKMTPEWKTQLGDIRQKLK